MYVVERVPLPKGGRGRRANPITEQMRKLAVGESFVVPFDDPDWKAGLVRNENHRHRSRYVQVRETNGYRIGRVA